MLKELYDKAALHVLMFGMALAAAVEIDEKFHVEYATIFYSCHTFFITIIIALVIYNHNSLGISLSRCVRDLVILVGVYGMAASSPKLAIYSLPVLGILTSLCFYYERKRSKASDFNPS
ncbi:hypothetical protein HMPREF0578_0948 [Mobiluncus mulieris 28-1]|uniref:hypothetical protein n=1 Tax=Mobiluncus mulieris TaxID=2052 RepID=UPI00019F8628|nr:hypothetical protein [Mobiluncus mulieris]EEJ53866.1 hypothetical protein HMPREF0577_1172 [Mobiluncus mulieris ATCC 35243]EEZ91630.1 hypothetical protein HMPREF0578_0948 [Mobiluncus mulieris 28-1]EFN93789.1 hypothetical protein HMPREF9278_0834 [Mobiluncus mulieris FB024-16]MCU9975929.1 hypothetical protein [Mobiluncus mulieris]MCU9994421.1 hypothetical protein [Mobiluncus mulieris]